MASRKKPGRKVRVEMRSNRARPSRGQDWTRQFQADEQRVVDADRSESVRAKGAVSRKRTLIVDDADLPAVNEAQWLQGVVTTIHGLVSQVDADGVTWECTTRRKLRTLLSEQRAPVAVGDRVWFSDQSRSHDGARVGVIERVNPRRSTLSRRDFRGREHTLVANADQLVIIASVARPRIKPHLIDRYLVAAGKGDLRPVICFHKWDLAGETSPDAPDDREEADAAGLALDELFDEFRALGYCCLRTSVTTGEGLDDLRRELRGRTSVLSGQSGVGKSSLINAMQPGLQLEVAQVSQENEKGRHTTTRARLLRLDLGGYVVDTPGIRQFDLWSVEPGELEAFFPEIAAQVSRCRFRDCHHREEDEGCAVTAAVASGRISARRYASYRKALSELAEERG
ncbi:MAG TPA: ribosome small subunit-dependent GTPase A [Phycisphaerae bacterium]|nr:ribosome small subunit-dependent GTPase A [Phycisphaerae bacterium]